MYVNMEKYQSNLNKIKGVCDFCLIGTGYADWLPLLGRLDIFEKLIVLVRKNGFIPLSVHHWTSLVLRKLDSVDFGGHWTYLNKGEQLIDEGDALKAIRDCKKPVTAFKALLSRDSVQVKSYFDYLFNKANVQAVDFGVETVDEAIDISAILIKKITCTSN